MGKNRKKQMSDIEETELQDGIHKKKKKRNLESLLITYFFVFLMLAVMGNIVYYVAAESETVINNSYNKRQELLAKNNVRGKILSRNGEVLAQTNVDENGKETRIYPYSNVFAHVVGFSTQGKTGIESLGNISLLTSNAFIGEKIQNELDAEKSIGDNVVTTLDVDLQRAAYDALGVYSGAIIVSDPNTGEVLAMVSKPDFDPNEIVTIWDDIIEDSDSSVLVNRATQGMYPPGSTFKIITALEYYRENKTSIEDYSYKCTGSFKDGENKIQCYHGASHGVVDFRKSFAKSCNASFANIGLSLKIRSLDTTCDELLFNEKLPVDIPYKESSFVLTEDNSKYDIMQTSIGQGKTQITPMHLNMITSAIANKGVLMKPYFIGSIENYAGVQVEEFKAETSKRLMTEEEALFLTEIMEAVVTEGTASKLSGLSYTAAGKTGSAEFSEVKEDSHAWFTGFAPVSNPEISVTIIVEGAGSGGDYAVPIAKKIFDAYFQE